MVRTPTAFARPSSRPEDPEHVRDDTVVSLIDERGLVRETRVTYDVLGNTGNYTVRITLTYGRIGETSVDPPAWYDEDLPPDEPASG